MRLLLTGADGFVHRWKNDVRVAVVLIGRVDEIAIPGTRTETFRARQRALDTEKRAVRC